MATKDTDPVVPDTQPRTSQGEAASGLGDASIYSRCPTCNDDPEAAPFCSNGCHAELADSLPNPSTVKGTGKLEAPYTTPIPTLHDGSTGWVYCDNCDAPQPVAGHECGLSSSVTQAMLDAVYDGGADCAVCERVTANGICTECRRGTSPLLLERAAKEFAESLLCAMAFDHASAIGAHRANLDSGCVFCSAAHGGGR